MQNLGGLFPYPSFKRGRTRVAAVSSGKGGVGKTTTAQNIAYNLAAQGYYVAIGDTDKQAMSSNLFDMNLVPPDKRFTLSHVIRNDVPMIDALYQARERLFVLPSDTNIEKANNHILIEQAHGVIKKRFKALMDVLGSPPTEPFEWQSMDKVSMKDFPPLGIPETTEDVMEKPPYLDFFIWDFPAEPALIGRAIYEITDEIWAPVGLEPMPLQGFLQNERILNDLYGDEPAKRPPTTVVIPFQPAHKRDRSNTYLIDLIHKYPEQVTRAIHRNEQIPDSQDVYPCQTLFEYEKTGKPSKEFFELSLRLGGYQGTFVGSPSCRNCEVVYQDASERFAVTH